MVLLMVEVESFTQMGVITLDNGKMESYMDMENFMGMMDQYIKESGKMIQNQDLEKKFLLTVHTLKGIM